MPSLYSSCMLHSVDVVVTCYNDAKTIVAALESVGIQNQALISRVLVIDNKSTDDSWGRIIEFCRTRRNYSYFVQQTPGAPAARNMGIRKSSAEFIAFLDGDDCWVAGKLDRQLSFMASSNSLFSYTDVLMRGQASETVFQCPDLPMGVDAQTRYLLKFSPAIFPSTIMLRRSLMERIGEFDEELLKAQDTMFCLRASLNARLDRVAEPLTVRQVRDGSLGSGYEEKRKYLYRVVSKFLEDQPQFESMRSDAIYSIDMHFLRRAVGDMKAYSWISVSRTILRHLCRRSMYPLIVEMLRGRAKS